MSYWKRNYVLNRSTSFFLEEETEGASREYRNAKGGRARFNSATDSENMITLPHSFALPPKQRARYEPISLQMSPQHEYRSNSMSYPSINDFMDMSCDMKKKPTVKKTHSDGSFGELLSSAEEERNAMQSNLSTDLLQNHMTDIIE